MFENWDIPDNICNTAPITADTLNLFVGREKDIELLDKLLQKHCVVLFEGEIGVGKTSMGNYSRFSKKGFYTPKSEIRCHPGWDPKIFIHEVLARITQDLIHNKEFQKVEKSKIIKKLKKKYEDSSSLNLGLSTPFGGISAGKNISRTNLTIQSTVENDLNEMGEEFKKFTGKDTPIILQLNNLDLGESFEEHELVQFFNGIRDILQNPYITWLINGSNGIGALISQKVKRVSQILDKTIDVPPLALDEIKEAFRKRIKSAGMKGKLPLNDKLLEEIYATSVGAFREVLNITNRLLMEYCDKPFKNQITIEDASLYFKSVLGQKLKSLESRKYSLEILKIISSKPGIIQKELVEMLTLPQANVSIQLRYLVDEAFLHFVRMGASQKYYLKPEIHFALKNID